MVFTMGVESKKVDRKILVVFSVVIVALVALSGYLYYNYTTTISAKDAQILSLMSENNALRSNVSALANENYGLKNEIKNLSNQLNALQLENAELKSTIKSLTDQNNALSAKKAELEKEVENLNAQIKSLTDERAKLLREVGDLTSQVNSLVAENEKLRNEISSLQNQIAYLNSRVRELEDIVNLRKSAVLDRDKTVNIPANSYIILSYRTPYAGYIRISFTATQAVDMWIGSDYVGKYYYYYSNTSGAFIVPVLPGTTYIYIRNPSWFLGVTVTLTVEYVY
jgi:peptidoglycan hydrolase CwlO-like protein